MKILEDYLQAMHSKQRRRLVWLIFTIYLCQIVLLKLSIFTLLMSNQAPLKIFLKKKYDFNILQGRLLEIGHCYTSCLGFFCFNIIIIHYNRPQICMNILCDNLRYPAKLVICHLQYIDNFLLRAKPPERPGCRIAYFVNNSFSFDPLS